MHPILKMVIQRLGLGLITLFVVSLIIFLAVEMLPGDVAQEILGQSATPETVAAFRSDSIRIKDLRAAGIDLMILSSEPNRVVEARARKMGVEAIHGVAIHEKGRVMREVLERKGIRAENVVYIGNDLNDLPCFEIAGWAVAVADAFPEVRRAADYILSKPGGHGALRELCDRVLSRK